MKIQVIKIKKDQYLNDVLKVIPSNSIIRKPTGSGITSKEIEEKRHSIIVEANRPVIRGKAKKYNKGNTRKLKIRAVNEGIEVSNIIEYLKSDVEYKKIITTPESYFKVIAAFKELGQLDEMYKTYFVLFDECEKTIQDIDYRKTIIQPMIDFFKYKQKAFVSATPIIPSDPRFTKQNFKMLIVEPDYDCKQDCNLVITNNTLYSLQKHFIAEQREQYFIFLNSTKAITTFINYLQINEESLIFCSEESRNKLKLNGYTNAREHLVESNQFAKYNFFTSRFNSAVDIEGVVNPRIIIITDTFLAEHTKVDPHTEVQQIVGRFRKPFGGTITRFLTHITNVSSDLISTPSEQILKDIEIFKGMHKVLVDYRDSSSSAFVRSVVNEMLERSEFSKYINTDGTTNYFMVDNAIYLNRVNGYYQTKESLINAYNSSESVNLFIDYQTYELTDEHKEQLKEASNLSSSLELLLPILKQLEIDGLDKFDIQLQLKQIEKEHPTAYNTFNILGFERAAELKYDYYKVKADIAKKISETQHGHFGLLSFLQENFLEGEGYTMMYIRSKLKKGIMQFRLDRLKPDLTLLERYFTISNRKYLKTVNSKKVYGYMVIKNKFKLKK
jgi:hypothetical protein